MLELFFFPRMSFHQSFWLTVLRNKSRLLYNFRVGYYNLGVGTLLQQQYLYFSDTVCILPCFENV